MIWVMECPQYTVNAFYSVKARANGAAKPVHESGRSDFVVSHVLFNAFVFLLCADCLHR